MRKATEDIIFDILQKGYVHLWSSKTGTSELRYFINSKGRDLILQIYNDDKGFQLFIGSKSSHIDNIKNEIPT